MVKPLAQAPKDSSARSTRLLGENVEDRLRRAILVGDFRPGEHLPPERALATTLGTNRNTLREALRTLESQGLVRAHQGAGTVVVDWRRDGDLSLLYHFLLEPTPPEERHRAVLTLLALRARLIEETVVLAAARASNEDLDDCDESLMALARAERGIDTVLADVELYRRLAIAAGSVVSTWVANGFSRIFVALGARFPEAWSNDAGYLRALGVLIAAIRRRDPAAARRQIRRIFADRDAFAIATLERIFATALATSPSSGSRQPSPPSPSLSLPLSSLPLRTSLRTRSSPSSQSPSLPSSSSRTPMVAPEPHRRRSAPRPVRRRSPR